MISCLGDKEGNAEGSGFLLLDSEFNVKGRWERPGHRPQFGYDYWYQPRHDVTISSSWGAPATFTKGFNLQHVSDGLYGRHLYVYSRPNGTGSGRDRAHTLGGGYLKHDLEPLAVSVKPLEVKNWILPEMPGFITDFLISLDDRFLCFANWLDEDIRRYNIEDPKNPVLTGQLWVGGLIQEGSSILAEGEDGKSFLYEVLEVQGQRLRGGPQMIQPSLDGKRLYVTNSLFSTWDRQFCPELVQKGSHILQIDADTDKGGLSINPNFFVDLFAEPDGPYLAHEMRFPGGDCTSDIWA